MMQKREGGYILWKGVYQTLCSLDLQSLANLSSLKDTATIVFDLDMYLIYSLFSYYHLLGEEEGYISAWASALLVLREMGNARRLKSRNG